VLALYNFHVLLLLGDANASSNDRFSEQRTGKSCTLQDHTVLLLILLLLSPDMFDLVASPYALAANKPDDDSREPASLCGRNGDTVTKGKP